MTVEALLIPAFIAGLFTFLAPCTLPLVPGYLGFISGVSLQQLSDPQQAAAARRRIFINGLLYVTGFSVVFVVLGTLVGFIGGVLFAESQVIVARIGGLFVVLFGLIMVQSALQFYADRWPVLRQFRLPFSGWLSGRHQGLAASALKPGSPISSIIFGAIFAVGWTPCVGPVLGAILTLAATGTTALEGAALLAIFSLGLGLPFLVLAASIGFFTRHMNGITKFLPLISLIGGVFIIFLGFLIVTNQLGFWIAFAYQAFEFLDYERIYNYL